MNPIGYFLSHLQFECNTTMFLLFVQVSLLLFRCSSECIIECQPLKNMLFLYIVKMMSMIMLVSATFDARNASVINREENHTSLVNSGFWVSIELFISLNQIIAAIVVLSLSKNEKPEIAVFTWVIGYILGCITTVSHICWRYHTRSENQDIEQESNIQRNRVNYLVDHTKMSLDCFFVVWSAVGNVWIFGGHSSFADAPNLHRLCTVFITFSYIGYAVPFILCATICCCMPYIIYITGIDEDTQDINHKRGTSPEFINTLPTCKFKAKREQGSEYLCENNCGEYGILGYTTGKEQLSSAEDALCCICLSEYVDNSIIKELPCTHFFHMKCIDRWLEIESFCPLCKSDVLESTSSDIWFS